MVRQLRLSSIVCRLRIAVVAACTLMAIQSEVTAAEVTARLDRESVVAGNAAVLTLQISGGRAEQPAMPQVENLIIQARGQSQQMQIFNGRTTVSVTYRYVVGSNTPGDYQIPAIEVTVDGRKVSTEPLKLKVLDPAAAKPPAGMPSQPAGQGGGSNESPDDAATRFGFLTVEPATHDRDYLYVGEIAPVCIRAWIPDGAQAQLRSGIQPEGQAFTLHNVSDQPRQSYETRDGKRYLVVTWYGGISATKAGKYPASLSVDATVAVRDSSAQPPSRPRGGAFGDPFFDHFFEDLNVPMIQKDVTLKSDDKEIEVRPLPTEGRPEGFGGAVGEFRLDRVSLPSTWKTGEPQQMSATISGTGNFALLDAPRPVPGDSWKVYQGKDDFTPRDVASFSGTKNFQFSAVPKKGGAQDVALEFSFFDPARGAYAEITSSPKHVLVSGEDMMEDQPSAASVESPPVPKGEQLVGQHVSATAPVALTPLVFRPAFLVILAAAGSMVILGGLLGLLRLWRGNPQRRAHAAMERATRNALALADRNAAAEDALGFLSAGRLALQERLAVEWNQPAHAITLAEVSARMPADSPVARFFREADHFVYGRRTGGGVPPHWRKLLDEAMGSLQETAR